MLRKTIRRSGMLALVLALALAGTVPAAAMDFGFGGRNLDGWHAVWNYVMGFFGWGDESSSAAGNSEGLTGVYERSGAGFDPNGNPIPVDPGTNAGAGFDPNGED
jgi:hypothetical protein